jgi:GAF domain-containing protein
MDHAAIHAVVGVLASCETIPEAFDALLPVLGMHIGWDIGATWRVDEDAQVLRAVGFWTAPGEGAPEFEAATRAARFSAGVGLPGRVWTTAGAHAIADVVRDRNFPRARAAKRDRLCRGYALPLRSGAEVVGVVEFFAREGRPIAERAMDRIADGIGLFLPRRAF